MFVGYSLEDDPEKDTRAEGDLRLEPEDDSAVEIEDEVDPTLQGPSNLAASASTLEPWYLPSGRPLGVHSEEDSAWAALDRVRNPNDRSLYEEAACHDPGIKLHIGGPHDQRKAARYRIRDNESRVRAVNESTQGQQSQNEPRLEPHPATQQQHHSSAADRARQHWVSHNDREGQQEPRPFRQDGRHRRDNRDQRPSPSNEPTQDPPARCCEHCVPVRKRFRRWTSMPYHAAFSGRASDWQSKEDDQEFYDSPFFAGQADELPVQDNDQRQVSPRGDHGDFWANDNQRIWEQRLKAIRAGDSSKVARTY